MTGAPPRILPRQAYLAIKAGFRLLVEAAGGVVAAAGGSRVGKTNLSDYGSINRLDVFAPADVIADLEASVGEPVVTRALARLAGYELYRLPAAPAEVNWVRLLGEASADTGAVIVRLARALGDDGRVTAAEVRTLDLIALADEALSELVRLRVAAAATLAAGEGGRP